MLIFYGNYSGVQAESTRLKGFRLKVGVPNTSAFSLYPFSLYPFGLQPIYLGS
jgi:hypothetical protein